MEIYAVKISCINLYLDHISDYNTQRQLQNGVLLDCLSTGSWSDARIELALTWYCTKFSHDEGITVLYP